MTGLQYHESQALTGLHILEDWLQLLVEPNVVGCMNPWLWSSLETLLGSGGALDAPLGCGKDIATRILGCSEALDDYCLQSLQKLNCLHTIYL